jgi:hypothetical protein
MPSLYTEIEINTSRQRVWQVLVHKEQWMYWNTFLYDRTPQQPFTQGQEVLLSFRRVPGEIETEFEARITLMQPNVCMQWVSAIPGFINEQVFELQDIGRDRTKYIHQERFSGLLTRLVLPVIRQDEQQGIRRMARELKQFAERQPKQNRSRP